MNDDTNTNFPNPDPYGPNSSPEAGWGFQKLTFGELTIEGVWVRDAAAARMLQQTLALASSRRPFRGVDDPMRRHHTRYLLADEIKLHLKALKLEPRSDGHIKSVSRSLDFLLHVAGNIPVGEITKDHILTTFDTIQRFPENPGRENRFKNKSIGEILKLSEGEIREPVARGTMRNHRAHLNAFFNTLLTDSSKLTVNPVLITGVDFDDDRGPVPERRFTQDELVQVFDRESFTKWANLPHRWWVPMLGLYTGARVKELSQLRVSDVVQTDGIWALRIRPYANNTVKSGPSIRMVPVAQPLIDAGFLTFVQDMKAVGHPRLFPHLARGKKRDSNEDNGAGYGTGMSVQFVKYVKRLGMLDRGMHSFRHYFIHTLAKRGIHKRDISAITGHVVKEDGPPERAQAIERYMGDIDDVILFKASETLAKFNPKVQLVPYRKGQFARVLSDRSAFHP